MRTALIDSDILGYTCAARVETKIDWGEVQTRETDFEKAKVEAVDFIETIKSATRSTAVILCFSDPSKVYFRHGIYPEYKAHRTAGQKPLILNQLMAWLRDESGYRVYVRHQLEADDEIGILATHPTLIPGERVIVSSDKDLKSIPGLHANPNKLDRGIEDISVPQADHNFYRQALSGDVTDGFKGCPGIGPKKADKIIQAAWDEYLDSEPDDFGPGGDIGVEPFVWKHTVAAYAAKGLSEAYALTQARVARILRASDYDFQNKRPILWTPSTAPCMSKQ